MGVDTPDQAAKAYVMLLIILSEEPKHKKANPMYKSHSQGVKSHKNRLKYSVFYVLLCVTADKHQVKLPKLGK